MDERELWLWLAALAEQHLIDGWNLQAEAGEDIAFSYIINGRTYTHDEAVKLVRHFEAAWTILT